MNLESPQQSTVLLRLTSKPQAESSVFYCSNTVIQQEQSLLVRHEIKSRVR